VLASARVYGWYGSMPTRPGASSAATSCAQALYVFSSLA
jgi:hypothetical protein